MKHGKDCYPLRIVCEIDRVGKFLEQGTPYLFTDGWEAERVVSNLFKRIADLGDEAFTQP